MVYENCKIYGPYIRADGRKHMCVVRPGNKRTTVSYPKYLVERRLGRYLASAETVDHLNGDFTDDSPENVRVIERSQHAREDARRPKVHEFECPQCEIQFSLSGKRLHYAVSNRRQRKAGPFCNRSCAGKYGAGIQQGRARLKVAEIVPEYTTHKLEQGLRRETDEVDVAKSGKP